MVSDATSSATGYENNFLIDGHCEELPAVLVGRRKDLGSKNEVGDPWMTFNITTKGTFIR